jgi:dephospho-CoA kinase
MLKVGITGGIGSGKSIVCRVFSTLGIPVFNADDAARHLMDTDAALRQSIIDLLGAEAYNGTTPNRDLIAAKVFHDPALLQGLNALVHPATIAYARRWMEAQTAAYIIKEAAIFFESGTHTDMDVMIGVSAPEELRIERAMKRGSVPREKVLAVIARQMPDKEKMRRCNHVISNNDVLPVLPQVLQLHQLLLQQ